MSIFAWAAKARRLPLFGCLDGEKLLWSHIECMCFRTSVLSSAKHGRHVKNVINFSFMFSDCSKVFACVFAYYIANDMHSIHCIFVGWMRERAVTTTKCYKHASICNDKHLTWKTISIVRVEISMWNVSAHTLTTGVCKLTIYFSHKFRMRLHVITQRTLLPLILLLPLNDIKTSDQFPFKWVVSRICCCFFSLLHRR